MLMNFLLIYIAILMMIFDGLAIVAIIQESKELKEVEEAKAKAEEEKVNIADAEEENTNA